METTGHGEHGELHSSLAEDEALIAKVLGGTEDEAGDTRDLIARTLPSPRYVDDVLPGWALVKLSDGSYEMYPVDSPREAPALPELEKTPKSKKRSFQYPGTLPKAKVVAAKTPGPGQYNINRDLVGRKWSFGYCPNRQRLQSTSSTWTPNVEPETPGATFVEWKKPKGVSILLPIEIPRWGLGDERPRPMPPGVGDDHPQEYNPPKWSIAFPLDSPTAKDSGEQTIPSKKDKLGDSKVKWTFGRKPDNLRYSNPDWTVIQHSNVIGPGYKFQRMDQTTCRGPKRDLGGTFPGRPAPHGLKTAGDEVPNMYVLSKFQSRTLRSESLRGYAFPSQSRFKV